MCIRDRSHPCITGGLPPVPWGLQFIGPRLHFIAIAASPGRVCLDYSPPVRDGQAGVEESGMNKKWLLGGLGMVLLAGAGVAVWTGALPMPGALAKSQAVAFGKKDGDKKPEVPLEFAPREVVQPSLARLPGSLEFSGPLVAPQTAVAVSYTHLDVYKRQLAHRARRR